MNYGKALSASEAVAAFSDIEQRAGQRPCARQDLENLRRELEGILRIRRQTGDQFMPETADVVKAADAARMAIYRAFATHDKALAHVAHLEGMVKRGHINAAIEQSISSPAALREFSDINLDFVRDAETEIKEKQRRLIIGAAAITVAIFIAASVIELLRKAS